MKLQDIYADIVSRLNQQGVRDYLYTYRDVVNAINDAIVNLKAEYVISGRYQDFVKTENINSIITEDVDYPFASTFTLDEPVMSEIPINQAILTVNVRLTEIEIVDSPVTLPKGTIATKNNKAYKLVESVENVNTFDLTFDIRDARHYVPNNGLKYFKDDIIFNLEDKSYYKIDEVFVNDNAQSPPITKVYWKLLHSNNKPAYFREFYELQNLKIADLYDKDCFYVTVDKDKVYITPKANKLTISYIPKWVPVIDREDEIELPDYMIPEVKNNALQLLSTKLQLQPMVQADEG